MQPIFEDEAAAEGAGMAKRKLLVPIDDSSESEKALAWAMEEMYRFNFCRYRVPNHNFDIT